MQVRPTNGVSYGVKYKVTGEEVDVAEVVTLVATGAPTVDGNVTVTLPSLSGVTVAVIGVAVAEVVELEVTAEPTADGNVTITLPSLAGVAVAVLDVDLINDVATKIRAATFTGWTTGGSGAIVTFTKNVAGAVSGTPTFSGGTTGVTATISITTVGVTADTTTTMATKIRAATFTGWTTGGSGTTVTFTKNVAGPVSGTPTFSGGTTTATATITITTVGTNHAVIFDFRQSSAAYRYDLVAYVYITDATGALANPVDLTITYPSHGVIQVDGSLVLDTIVNVVAQWDCLSV
jgi:hypothetical protein